MPTRQSRAKFFRAHYHETGSFGDGRAADRADGKKKQPKASHDTDLLALLGRARKKERVLRMVQKRRGNEKRELLAYTCNETSAVRERALLRSKEKISIGRRCA